MSFIAQFWHLLIFVMHTPRFKLCISRCNFQIIIFKKNYTHKLQKEKEKEKKKKHSIGLAKTSLSYDAKIIIFYLWAGSYWHVMSFTIKVVLAYFSYNGMYWPVLARIDISDSTIKKIQNWKKLLKNILFNLIYWLMYLS